MFVSYRLSASCTGTRAQSLCVLWRRSVGCGKFYSNNALFFASAPGFFVSAMRLAYAPKLLRSRLYLTPYRLRLQGIDLKFYRKPQP
jgi:hypothetical protein